MLRSIFRRNLKQEIFWGKFTARMELLGVNFVKEEFYVGGKFLSRNFRRGIFNGEAGLPGII